MNEKKAKRQRIEARINRNIRYQKLILEYHKKLDLWRLEEPLKYQVFKWISWRLSKPKRPRVYEY